MTTKRITHEMVEFRVSLINDIEHRPVIGIGSYALDYEPQHGGYKLVEILDGYAYHDVITSNRLDARAMYYMLKGYCEGYLAAKWDNPAMHNETNTLTDSVSKLKMLVEELKPYRDGYDANEILPEEGENVIAETQHEMFLAQRRGDAWYYSFGDKSKVIKLLTKLSAGGNCRICNE